MSDLCKDSQREKRKKERKDSILSAMNASNGKNGRGLKYRHLFSNTKREKTVGIWALMVVVVLLLRRHIMEGWILIGRYESVIWV